ncbi:hypothetical protein F3N42_08460 [Marinihelvus fidelis]|uniref:Uncharacterized protein n=1 Tax=Marinihelvus fidelis TaxID=2613842 RepID=A0A5N0T8J2_9GAMM|nr:hypothetical protein [Marinihelvus fidelis]KAA9131345.1 hypothetical protein F3N42_08460 [Marinihelvus fidelis]
MSLFAELKRRNVFRVGIAYLIVAWLVIQVADVMIDNIGAPDWLFSGILLVLAIGFALALVFAWAFELTPEGIKREHQVDRSQSITPQTGQKLNFLIIGGLSLAVVYLLVDKLVLQDRADAPAQAVESTAPANDAASTDVTEVPDKPSVAVLPFVNMSDDKANEYFSDGLTETLLHMLAQLPDLQVPARTSSFAFKGQNTSVSEIAAVLGVAHILEGSVQRAGDRVRVTAQLIRAEDGYHVWSQSYTRPLDDIFAIQDEIATDVARSLDASLLGSDEMLHGVETQNTAAYDIYLQALEQQALGTYASLPLAESLFKKALAQDPDFIDAKLGLVRNYLGKAFTGLIDTDQAWLLSEPLLGQVLVAQPNHPVAQLMENSFTLLPDNSNSSPDDFVGALNRIRDLLPLAPTESRLRANTAMMAHFFISDDRTPLALLDAGLRIDPLEPELLNAKGFVLREQRRFEEADLWFMKAYEQAPDDPNIRGNIAQLKADTGDIKGELEWLRLASESDPHDHELAAMLASRFYDLDMAEEGDRWTNRVLSLAPRSPMGRKVELERARAHGDDALALTLARSMLEDDIDFRHGSFSSAVFGYVELMTDAGKAREGFDELSALRPGAMAFDGQPGSLTDGLVIMAALEWLPLIFEPEDVNRMWQNARVSLDHALPRWVENPIAKLWIARYEEDPQSAQSVVLDELIPRPPGRNLGLPDLLARPVMQPVFEDPEVQAALAQLEREADALRGEVREMLLQPEWNP